MIWLPNWLSTVFPSCCFQIFIVKGIFIQSQVVSRMDRESYWQSFQNNSKIHKLTAYCVIPLVSRICFQVVKFLLKLSHSSIEDSGASYCKIIREIWFIFVKVFSEMTFNLPHSWFHCSWCKTGFCCPFISPFVVSVLNLHFFG